VFNRRFNGALLLATLSVLALACVPAFGQGGVYPDWKGQWQNPLASAKGAPWDPTKPLGLAQQAPLTPEYQSRFEASVASQAAGGHGNDYRSDCVLDGMPRVMSLDGPMEFLIRPNLTALLFQNAQPRRIYTDGRDWPDEPPTFQGYSIAKWTDKDRDGRYHTLEVETRNFTGPRVFEASGLPLHDNNGTIVKERIFLDRTNGDVLHDEITTVDDALTRPWTVIKSYVRNRNPKWSEYHCEVTNTNVRIGPEEYAVGVDGLLRPFRQGQPPPDLRYFKSE
jgi:hypothetical protein